MGPELSLGMQRVAFANTVSGMTCFHLQNFTNPVFPSSKDLSIPYYKAAPVFYSSVPVTVGCILVEFGPPLEAA